MTQLDDALIMKYDDRSANLPIAILLFWLVLLLGVLTFADPDPVDESDRIWVCVIFLIVVIGLPWIIFIELTGTRVYVDNNGIHIQSYWRGRRSIDWIDIKTIRYGLHGDTLVFVGRRQKIGFHLIISDEKHWGDLLNMVHERVPMEKIKDEDIREAVKAAVAERQLNRN